MGYKPEWPNAHPDLVTDAQVATIRAFGSASKNSNRSSNAFFRSIRAKGFDYFMEMQPLETSGRLKPSYLKTSSLDRAAFFRQRVGERLLDLGSGSTNIFQGIIAGSRVVHVDRQFVPLPHFVQADASKLPFSDHIADSAYMAPFDGQYAPQILPEILRVVRKDGIVILSPMNVDSLFDVLEVTSRLGIDARKSGELTLNRNRIKHQQEPLSFEAAPNLYLTLYLSGASSITRIATKFKNQTLNAYAVADQEHR